MNQSFQKLLEGNKIWVKQMNAENPDFFSNLAKGQSPESLWIGCSDSRIPADQITNTLPGEIFVHRNIANMVVNTDINMLSVLQYAVEILKVKHVIVCGHYGCGGINAAISHKGYGLLDNWLRNIKDIYRFHQEELLQIKDKEMLSRRLVELNIHEQVLNLAKTSIIQDAWQQGQEIYLHGIVYELEEGLIRDLDINIKDNNDLERIYHFNFNI